ncbi:hypothetical protein Nepgr_015144 [Nepenthes gracilis]|uniref:Uncharacterized protein n=1 Tax=Nepenthes gracilis TaxID=150966 RepID=A0AAD3XQG9_NEPGR|nr:hypothetical protein Nepgr_015144 [Nepenthes gracilis]
MREVGVEESTRSIDRTKKLSMRIPEIYNQRLDYADNQEACLCKRVGGSRIGATFSSLLSPWQTHKERVKRT